MTRVYTLAAFLLGALLVSAPLASAQAADPLLEARKETALASDAVRRMQGFAQRGQTRGVEVAAHDYSRAMERALERIRAAELQGRDVTTALAEVERATATHGNVLAGLLGQVPEEAEPAILRALDVSQKGRNTALERLGALGAGAPGGPPGGLGGGPPSGFGGGPPSGFGGGPGGPLSGFGGGPPSGFGGGPGGPPAGLGGPPGGVGGPRR